MPKGRPKKDPVETLKTLTLMRYVCMSTQKFTGYQLEKFFEPHLINTQDGVTTRSCKWDRYLKGTSPNPLTLELIFSHYPNAKNIHCLPLWSALKAHELHPLYWNDFYQSLDLKLSKLCHRYRAFDNVSSTTIGKNKSTALDFIFKESNIDSLACLIALLRENKDNIFEYDVIETAIFNLIFWILTEEPYFSMRHVILSFLKDYIFINDRHERVRESPWDMTTEEIDMRISINNKNILMAEDISLIWGRQQTQEFIYWKFKGNSKLIVKEIAEVLNYRKWGVSESEMGLVWLIKQLNKSRPHNDKITLTPT